MPCLIPGCKNKAPYFLGIRLRRPKMPPKYKSYGTAIWAPDCEVFLCKDHAAQGYKIDIRLTPIASRDIITKVSVAGGKIISRTKPIKKTP